VRERFGYWHRAICDAIIGAEAESPLPGPFMATIAARRAADFGFASFASSGHTVIRPARMARGDCAPFLVSLQLRGESRYGGDGCGGAEVVSVKKGDIALVNTGRPFRLVFPADVSRVIAILPRPLVRAHVPWCNDIGTMKLDDALPAAEPLRAHLATAGRALLTLDERTAAAFLDNVANLLALMLVPAARAVADNAALRRARLQGLCAYTLRNLANPELDPRRAAAALGISVRLVHRLFEDTGITFGRWLLDRRLDACKKSLDDPAQASRAISDIAFAWGFNELSHFSRAFKARFGESPRRYRVRAGRNMSAP
jgi:AraC family transcriptional regulator, positive regulator of tynA and feaB